jgi:hypothetical protein
MKYIFEVTYPSGEKELEPVWGETLEEAEEELELKCIMFGAGAQYDLWEVVEPVAS